VRTGKTEEALREYSRCLALRPGDAVCYNNRAAAYFQLGHFSEAAVDIETCRRLGGDPHPGLIQALAKAAKDLNQ
jgi:Flp pilus assembly protein TadD